jgi:hypothetical protein
MLHSLELLACFDIGSLSPAVLVTSCIHYLRWVETANVDAHFAITNVMVVFANDVGNGHVL